MTLGPVEFLDRSRAFPPDTHRLRHGRAKQARSKAFLAKPKSSEKSADEESIPAN
jgi:hypothetical protein